MVSVTVTPSTGTVGEALVYAATATDADGGEPTIAYTWSDGTEGDNLTIAPAPKRATLVCTAAATDTDGGTATGTAEATVTNTDPVVESVTVTPATGKVGDTLTCAASLDADGDAPTATYTWPDGTDGSSYTIAETTTPAAPSRTVTATDITGATATGSADATVENTAPVITASVDPETTQVGDTLTCTATASDADGGEPSITYAWSDGRRMRSTP